MSSPETDVAIASSNDLLQMPYRRTKAWGSVYGKAAHGKVAGKMKLVSYALATLATTSNICLLSYLPAYIYIYIIKYIFLIMSYMSYRLTNPP